MIPLLAGPAAKILGAVIGIAAIAGGGYWLGYTRCDNSNKASIMEQALEANENMRKANDNLVRVERERDEAMARHDVTIETVETIKVKYVQGPSKKCVVSPELERTVDAISRVHDPTTDSLPAPTDSPGAVAESPAPPVTDAALVAAYEYCTGKLYETYDLYYRPLTDWVKSSQSIALEGAGYP